MGGLQRFGLDLNCRVDFDGDDRLDIWRYDRFDVRRNSWLDVGRDGWLDVFLFDSSHFDFDMRGCRRMRRRPAFRLGPCQDPISEGYRGGAS